MTQKKYTLQNYSNDSSKFGGLVYLSDFNTECKKMTCFEGSAIASRIISDWKFDEQCRKNLEIRKNAKAKGE